MLLSKWMFGAPRVVLLDEPSRGVDIGARRRIHDFVVELAAGGAAVLLVSSEIEEVIGLSHRAYLMSRGRIVGEVDAGRRPPSRTCSSACSSRSTAAEWTRAAPACRRESP